MPTVREKLIGELGRGGVAVGEAPADATPMQLWQQCATGVARQRVLASALGIAFVEDLAGRHASAGFLERVPIGFARRHGVLGLASDEEAMPVAIAELDAWPCLDALARLLDRPVEPVLAPPEAVATTINHAYRQRTGQADAMIASLRGANGGEADRVDPRKLDQQSVLAEVQALDQASHEDLLDVGGRAPVIKLVNLMLFEAVKQEASDVHVQPYEQRLVIRLRIDGVLFDQFELPRALLDEVVSRIKVMGRMNIAEKRLPQDGRATVQVGDAQVDLRISCVPSSHGERVVVRLLDKSARLYTLPELGMPEDIFRGFRGLIGIEHGLVLVTGPTGSGKTTTLYAALQELNSTQSNVITLEDPIEYQLDGISQIQVATRKGMTFASGLRSVLRQDPDIIMVGEIRDHETAVLAIQSALTGHLVFSTLHTNDAASAVTRLLDLGIEPYLVASSVVGVMAQRLVRRVCHACAAPVPPEEATQQLERLGVGVEEGLDVDRMRQGIGCETCRGTGYRGRVGLFELLTVDEAIRQHVQERATASQIKKAARAAGMRSLAEDGRDKVLAGQSTVDEILRVTLQSTR